MSGKACIKRETRRRIRHELRKSEGFLKIGRRFSRSKWGDGDLAGKFRERIPQEV